MARISHNHMMHLDPEEVVFTSVRLHQVYSQCVRVTNPLSCAVDIDIVSGNTERFSVHPATLHLDPGQHALVEVRLQLRKPVAKGKLAGDDRRAHREVFHVRSAFFKQKFFAQFSVWGAVPAVNLSPQAPVLPLVATVRRRQAPQEGTERFMEMERPLMEAILSPPVLTPTVDEAVREERTRQELARELVEGKLQAALVATDRLGADVVDLNGRLAMAREESASNCRKARSFDEITAMLSKKMPEVTAMVDLIVEQERDDNELKNHKVLQILRAKDEQIGSLEKVVEVCRSETAAQGQSIRDLEAKLTGLMAELASARDTIKEGREEMARKEELFQQQTQLMQQQIDEQSASADSNGRTIDSLQRENDSLVEHLKTAKRELRNLREQGDPIALTLELQKQKQEMELVLERTKGEAGILHAQMAQHRNEITAMKNKLVAYKSIKVEAIQASEKVQELEGSLATITSERDSMARERDEAEGEIQRKDELISQLQEEIVRDRERTSFQKMDRMADELAAAREEARQHQYTVDRLQILHAKAQTALLNSERQLHVLQEKCTAGEATNDRPALSAIRKSIAALYRGVCPNSQAQDDLSVMITAIHAAFDTAMARCKCAQSMQTTANNQLHQKELEHIREIGAVKDDLRRVSHELRLSNLQQRHAPGDKERDLIDPEVQRVELANVRQERRDIEEQCRLLSAQVAEHMAREAAHTPSVETAERDAVAASNILQRIQRQQAEIERLEALVACEDVTVIAAERASKSNEQRIAELELVRENERLSCDLEKGRIEIVQLQSELRNERQIVMHAERRLYDMQSSVDVLDRIPNREGEPSALQSQPCSLCDNALARAERAERRSLDLQTSLAKETPSHSQVAAFSAGDDVLRRLSEVEAELDQRKAHCDVLMRTIDALHGGEENRRLREKNDHIITLAAQLSSTKALEIASSGRLREMNITLARLHQAAEQSRSAFHTLELHNQHLHNDCLQIASERSHLVQEVARLERLLAQMNAQHQRYQTMERDQHRSSAVILSLREEIVDQRQRFAASLGALRDECDQVQISSAAVCASCEQADETARAVGLSAIESMAVLIEKLGDSVEAIRLLTLIDSIRDQFVEQERFEQQRRKEHRILQLSSNRSNAKIIILEHNVDVLRTDLNLRQRELANATAALSPPPTTSFGAIQPAEIVANYYVGPSPDLMLASCNARVRLITKQRDRLQRQLEAANLQLPSQVHQAEHIVREQMISRIGAHVASIEKFLQSATAAATAGGIADAGETPTGSIMARQLTASKLVEAELLERVDALGRERDQLQCQSLTHHQMIQELEDRLSDRDQCDSDDKALAEFDEMREDAVQRIAEMQSELDAVRAVSSADRRDYREAQTQWNNGPVTMDQATQSVPADRTDDNADESNQLQLREAREQCAAVLMQIDEQNRTLNAVQQSRDEAEHTMATLRREMTALSQTNADLKRSIVGDLLRDGAAVEDASVPPCSLQDVVAARTILMRMGRHVSTLLRACDSAANNSNDLHDVRDVIKIEAMRIGVAWKQMEPTICALCDERTKLSKGVEMLRAQLKHLTAMRAQIDLAAASRKDVGTDPREDNEENTSREVNTDHSVANIVEFDTVVKDATMRRRPEDMDTVDRHWKKKYRSLKSKLDSASFQLCAVKTRLSNLEAAHVAEIEALRNSFADERAHLVSLHEARIGRNRQSIDQVKSEAKKEADELRVQMSAELEQHTGQFGALLSEFERSRAEHERSVTMYQEKIVQLEGRVQAAQHTQSPVRVLHDPIVARQLSFNVEQELRAELVSQREHIGTLQERLSTSTNLCKTLRQQIQQHDPPTTISRTTSPNQDSDNTLTKLQNRLAQSRAHVKTLSQQLAAKSDELAQFAPMQRQFETLQKEAESRDKKAKQMQHGMASRDRTIEDLRQRLSRLSEADCDVRTANNKVHEKIHSLTGDLARKQTRVKELAAKVEALQAEVDELRQLRGNVQRLKGVSTRKDASLQAIQAQLSRSKDECSTAHDTVRDIQAQLDERKRDMMRLKKSLHESNATTKSLKAAIRCVGIDTLNTIHEIRQLAPSPAKRSFSKTSPIDVVSLSKTVPEFTLKELEEVLGSDDYDPDPKSPDLDPKQYSLDSEAHLDQLLKEPIVAPSVIRDTLSRWIDERVSLERLHRSTSI